MTVALHGMAVAMALLFLAGCPSEDLRDPGTEAPMADEVPLPEGGSAVSNPHAKGWENPASHGSWVIQYDFTPCLECHLIDSGKVENPATCTSCHPMFPHEIGWVRKESHGAEVMANGTGACATLCHGTDLKGGLSGISCDTCHATYPHPPGWVDPRQHGEAAKGVNNSRCKLCHGSDLLGGDSGVSCYQCHAVYPHVPDWGKPEKHGAVVLAEGPGACATQCHGPGLNGGLSGVACDSCHNLYPHPEGWEFDHGATVLSVGTTACQPCHGEDLSKYLNGKNCTSCHQDYPHPDPSLWLPFTGGHGETVQWDHSGETGPCQVCHGLDLRRIKPDGKNCFSCHPTYPHDKYSSISWVTYGGHGFYALPFSNRPECELCHGADYDGGPRSNPSCFSCHVTYPHLQPGWLRPPGEPQEHGNYVVANTSSSCATARCHGNALVPVPGVTNGPDCTSCHASYPHAPGWVSGYLHGPVAMADISVCKDCHGAGLDVAPPGYQSCVQCHPSYLRHETADLGFTNWDTYAGHGQYVMNPPLSGDTSPCTTCHGYDYLGGLSHVSCKSCHASYPHDSPGWETGIVHGDYVLTTLGGDFTTCKVCHGNDFLGGISGVSCKSCHASYPHDAVGWETGTGHGDYVQTTLGGNLTTCKPCHGADLQGGISGVSCNSCHANYPHSIIPGWSGSGHGLQADTPEEREACKTCHGADLLGGSSGVSCRSCHASYPHDTPGWETGTGHGDYVQTTLGGNLTACKLCHGANLQGGNTGVSCNSCHPNYPHSILPGWAVTGHGPNADTPAERESCKMCHGADLLGGSSGISCKSCHTNFPHPPEWMSLQSETIMTTGECCDPVDEFDCWTCTISTDVDRMTLHGQKFIEQKEAGFVNNPSRCSNCHGAGYDEPLNGNSCVTCHAGYPHVKYTNWVDLPSATPIGGQHTPSFLAGPTDLTSPCTNCHLNFGPGLEPVGLAGTGLNAAACSSCHSSYPHLRLNLSPDSWIYRAGVPPATPHAWQRNHGWYFIIESYTETHSSDPNMCKDCHGSNLLGIGGIAQETKRCSRCHTTGVVSHAYPTWRPATGHGKNYIRARLAGFTVDQPDRCHECHDENHSRSPRVCNPFTAEFPGSGSDWCSSCHIPDPPVPGMCPCPGMDPVTGICP